MPPIRYTSINFLTFTSSFFVFFFFFILRISGNRKFIRRHNCLTSFTFNRFIKNSDLNFIRAIHNTSMLFRTLEILKKIMMYRLLLSIQSLNIKYKEN